jgi:Helix-hairpin-helix containing domain
VPERRTGADAVQVMSENPYRLARDIRGIGLKTADAHTDGDYVFFRDANVLAAGDAISPMKDPVLDWFGGGWLGGRVDAQEKLLKFSDEKTRIVPSYGPVVGRAELQAEFDMTRMLFDRMLDMVRKGMSAQDMLDAGLMKDLNRTFRDPYRFTYDAHKGYWAHHNSLAGGEREVRVCGSSPPGRRELDHRTRPSKRRSAQLACHVHDRLCGFAAAGTENIGRATFELRFPRRDG